MFSIFHSPRRYPRHFVPHHDALNFYDGRKKWLESTAGVPREIVHLYAVHWLHLEVYNGGFWQYFYNSTGVTCPEAVEGFNAIGMPDVSNVVQQAPAKLGTEFPFDLEMRRSIVGDPQNRMPFEELDTEFHELADTPKFFRRQPKFVPFAEAYADFLPPGK